MANKLKYTVGYSKHAFSSQEWRTAETDAAFLLPHIQPHFRILDVGCGPGTISAGLAKYVPEGKVVAIDMSPQALEQARENANALPDGYPSNLEFHCIDILKQPSPSEPSNSSASEATNASPPDGNHPAALPTDWLNSFDIIYESNVLIHLKNPEKTIQTLKAFLKPGTGFFATHDYDVLTCLYMPDPAGKLTHVGKTFTSLISAGTEERSSGLARDVPTWLEQSGLPREKMSISGGTIVYGTPEERKGWGAYMAAFFSEGDALREGMIARSVLTATECDEIRDALIKWSEDPAGWYMWTAVQVVAPLE